MTIETTIEIVQEPWEDVYYDIQSVEAQALVQKYNQNVSLCEEIAYLDYLHCYCFLNQIKDILLNSWFYVHTFVSNFSHRKYRINQKPLSEWETALKCRDSII